MGTISLGQAALWCGGTVDPKYHDHVFLGATDNLSKLRPGRLFVALPEREHEIPAAMEAGATAALSAHPVGDYPVIVVDDVCRALGEIARQERIRIGMKVVGITGSIGKSTIKDMAADVLATSYRVSKNPSVVGNIEELLMSMLSIPEDIQIAVLEIGRNQLKEVSYLASIVRPDLAVISNIGTMNIEYMGSRQGVLQAKLESVEGVRDDTVLMFNGDDSLLWNVRQNTINPLIYYGIENPDNNYQGVNIFCDETGVRFLARTPAGELKIHVPQEGAHFAQAAMAAVAIGMELGVPAEKIVQALSNYQDLDTKHRMLEVKGSTLIIDSGNAGPESMCADLSVLGNKTGRRVAVLGDMPELGFCAPAEHYRVGRVAAENVQLLLTIGEYAGRTVSGAITGGMPNHMAKAFTDRAALLQTMRRMIKPGDQVLFKGSSEMHMEQIAEEFVELLNGSL